ncbi:MAG: DEAD/DEAH box helicase family protein [Candidatus Methanoperedens sp.]|nr:DEAD/DEAH box helicase family protein [Candidatus Methanoperedens sp.]CAG0978410.1 Type-1 restriction enzyme R protein [Methanosarcinales archaeon]
MTIYLNDVIYSNGRMGPETDDIQLINENQTRKKLIDPDLKKMGWLLKYIKEEVNSIKSDFKNKNFVLFDGNIEKNIDRFIDYVLLDEDYSVLAIIESKRFSLNEDKGRIQARTYSKDIEAQHNRKIPIFLTNGRIWRFIDENGIERKVSGPFSQEDLKRRSDLYGQRRDPRTVKTNPRIIDRSRNFQIVRQLSEHFSHGHRKALLQMATGTGKTRVAMAIIDLLINANMIRNVLFIADRIPLVNQAKNNGFQEFFKEPVADLREGFSSSGRLYVSTIQTLMNGYPKKLFERFSPGFFDLIVFDEAHRSIYDKNNLINEYFDAIKIGLTATPRERETKNTYVLFECEHDIPTVEYSYDEAVQDGVLVTYNAEIIDTKILSLGIKGGELTKELKDQLRRQEENPDTSEYPGSQFDKVFMDDKTNELIIREFMSLCYKSDEGKPCKSIFFCASQRHAEYMKTIFGKLFPNLSNDVQVITSNKDRAEDEVKRFQLQSEPRIALSVGMLDTGVDIPEVCNLVFVKPVFSYIRFWQMVGRGTRNLGACKHPDWLPLRDKKDFKIFDFKIGGHSNIKYHEFKVSKERAPQKDVIIKIFENRVELLKKKLDENQRELISGKIMEPIESLDKDSFIVREKLPIIYEIQTNSFNLERYVDALKKEISPMMILNEGTNANVSSFILNTEKLFSHVLDKDFAKIEKIKRYVWEMARNIIRKENLSEIKNNKEKIMKVLQDDFWNGLTFDDVEFIIRELAPLMKYYEPNPRKIIQIDAPDLVLSREKFVKEIKEDLKLKEFLEKNPYIMKIKSGEGITSSELKQLEAQLTELRPEMTIENIQKYQKKDFVVFLGEIIGLTNDNNPRQLIELKFDEFIIKNNNYNSKQLEFLEVLKKVFADRKYIELSDMAELPLSAERPLDYFQMADLKSIVAKCDAIKVC